MQNTILITGANGQLGSEFKSLTHNYPHFQFVFTDIDELDITDGNLVEQFIENVKPHYIVNCAAYTAVDKAETDQQQAYKLNADAPLLLANASKKCGCKIIHISTDYVFNGNSNTPYSETDPVDPTSVYGKSKLEGEQAVLQSGAGMVIRTSWLYSAWGNNFLKTIINRARLQSELKVVYDQIGTPTWANHLAKAILRIIEQGSEKFKPEIFHYSNEGVCSWYDFAIEICDTLSINCQIKAILSHEFPSAVKRPHYSVLNKGKIKKYYTLEIPHWKQGLRECIRILQKN